MLTYKKLSRTNRTMAAILLLLVFMALAMADLFITFFGGIVLGVLLMQFEMEVQRFFRRSFAKKPMKAGLMKRYGNLSRDKKIYSKAGLLLATIILLLTDIIDNFWGGIITGVLLAMLADDITRNRHRRSKASSIR